MKQSRLVAIAIASVALVPATLSAATFTNASKHFSVPLSDCWHMTSDLTSEQFFSCTGHDSLGAVVEIIEGAPLNSPAVIQRIDLSNRVVKLDRKTKVKGLRARRLDGTARSEGQDLLFRSITIDPGHGAALIQFQVWDSPEDFANAGVKADVQDMLAGFNYLP